MLHHPEHSELPPAFNGPNVCLPRLAGLWCDSCRRVVPSKTNTQNFAFCVACSAKRFILDTPRLRRAREKHRTLVRRTRRQVLTYAPFGENE